MHPTIIGGFLNKYVKKCGKCLLKIVCKEILGDIYKQMRKIIRHTVRKYLREAVKNSDFVVLEEFEGSQEKLEFLKRNIEKRLEKVFKEVTGRDLELPKIDIILDSDIIDGKIAGFNHPEHEGDTGTLGIKPKALNNMDYLEDVITHELIHAAVGDDLPTHQEHGGLFNKLAEKMGLPHERRD